MSFFDEHAQRCHPYSLLPRCLHNPLLVQLIDYGVTIEMIDYVTLQTIETVRIDGQRSGADPSLRNFIHRLVEHVNVSVGTLLTTVIYYDRIRPKLTEASGARGARHRLFLATLIVASKYLNDSSPKTLHWQKYANITTLQNVNIMERQLLELLDYNLRFNEEEACRYFAPFMALRAQRASTRAIAVHKVSKASRARAQAQADAQARTSQTQNEQQYSSEVSSLQPLPSDSTLMPPALASAVKDIVKNPHLTRNSLAPPVMHYSLSSDSASSSSSDIGSLIDDTGSSSGSSSGWNTSDSESDSEEERYIEPRVYSNSSLDSYPDHYPNSNLYRSGFLVRPIPACKHKDSQLQNRSRRPSDTSSVRTVTGITPSFDHSSTSRTRHISKRSASIVIGNINNLKESPLSSSSTMPSIPRTGLSGNFLSRMWGAAKAQAGCHDKTGGGDSDSDIQMSSAFRRLVLAPSRSAMSRTTTTSSVNV
ncbi:hypothetical protein E1B28_003961 [Marasmius oreades]|uniref:Cyclin N-terminal domain-containing protein n=1 Tax=Marasmius oreades TaxID=181124 RepID=A0A9P7UXN4_9AGAR|nr:uncharacterized protein E1B28_003961 [Marasmius oreades]KAG7096533.1 hypothetical protein E1B28_003961 [Marasmius oreades]